MKALFVELRLVDVGVALSCAAAAVTFGCGSEEPGATASMAGNSSTAGAPGDAGASSEGGGASDGCVASATDEEQPLLLSATGCIDMAEPSRPAPGLVPYSVASPLWSDGAAKERFVRVPAGQKIHVRDCAVDADACKEPGLGGTGEDDGHFGMPVGTVLVKSFSIDGQRIETRLLMRRSTSNLTGWKGFTYEWNDAQTEATLLPDDETGKDKPVGSSQQVWHYPSRAECMDCHTRYAGRSLGLSTAQLNSDFAYADGVMNQLEKLEQLGLFETTPKPMAAYPEPEGDASLDARARSYLHANCGTCHRPGGAATSVDLRFETAFADTALCEEVERDAGKVPGYRLVPGDPAASSLAFRMRVLDALRMPKLGSSVVDAAGSKLIDDWITAMPANACPPRP